MRLLVTGASGFAGTHLCRHLSEVGHEVAAMGEDADGRVSVDVRDRDAVFAAVEEHRPDGIIHLAAVAFVPTADADPGLSDAVNRGGTINVLDAALEHGIRVLAVSSGAVYGSLAEDELPATEDMPLRAQRGYAESKAAAELECARRRGAQDIVCVRPFNHTGPGQSPDYVCSDFAKQVAECEAGLREPRIEVGDLRSQRDFSDVRDVVRAYRQAFEQGLPGEAYNVCSGVATEISVVLERLVSMARVPVAIEVDQQRLRPGEVNKLYGSFAKLESQCGWRPQISLETTLADLLDYWRSQVQG